MVCRTESSKNTDIMFEALQFEFIRNALIAGLLTSLICGVIGSLVVVNRIVFLSGGIAHAAYGGIGLAFFLGLPYLLSTLAFALAAAVIMALVTLKSKQRSDTIIGVLWAVGMALGIVLIDLTPGYNVDLMSYLFGSILTVPTSDLWLMALLGIAIVVVVIYFYDIFMALSYDAEFAQIRGIATKPMYVLMIGMIAVAIVITIRVVGLILVIALLTIPPFIAERYAKSLSGMMLVAGLLSALFTLLGLWFSYAFNLTSGACIVLAAGTGFLLSTLLERKRRAKVEKITKGQ
jgi:zinc transport system permease protein